MSDEKSYTDVLAQGKRLALLIKYEAHIIRPNKTYIRRSRQICRVYPVKSSKNDKDSSVLYAFDLRKGFKKYRWEWNPKNALLHNK